MKQRKEFLLKQGKCFRCIKKFHKKQFCRSPKIQCVFCFSKTRQISFCNTKIKERSSNEKEKKHLKYFQLRVKGDRKMINNNKKKIDSSLCCKSDEYIYFKTFNGIMIRTKKNCSHIFGYCVTANLRKQKGCQIVGF